MLRRAFPLLPFYSWVAPPPIMPPALPSSPPAPIRGALPRRPTLPPQPRHLHLQWPADDRAADGGEGGGVRRRGDERLLLARHYMPRRKWCRTRDCGIHTCQRNLQMWRWSSDGVALIRPSTPLPRVVDDYAGCRKRPSLRPHWQSGGTKWAFKLAPSPMVCATSSKANGLYAYRGVYDSRGASPPKRGPIPTAFANPRPM